MTWQATLKPYAYLQAPDHLTWLLGRVDIVISAENSFSAVKIQREERENPDGRAPRPTLVPTPSCLMSAAPSKNNTHLRNQSINHESISANIVVGSPLWEALEVSVFE